MKNMNEIRFVNQNGEILDTMETKYEYEVGEVITLNSTSRFKCKEVVNGLTHTTFVFVEGIISFGF